MADKTAEKPEVPAQELEKDKKVVEEKEKKAVVEEKEKKVEKEKVKEKEKETKENGDVEKENGKEESNGDSTPPPAEGDKCCVKRKSTGGDAPKEKPAEGATPEKKAKLDEPAEAESNGEAEVAA